MQNPYTAQQVKLANFLHVRIEDYPYQYSFPVGYFDSVLKPGMAVDEVHNVIKGYEKVLNCGSWSEIYSYFSTDDSRALRLEIFYDTHGTYQDIQGEDRNSKTIRAEGCVDGLIER